EITPDAIQLNIKVANLTGTPDTKAAKTGWVNGDKINIWFDDWNYKEPVENHTPDMVITYDGSVWKVSSQVSGLSARLKANGKLTALFEGFNDLSKYTYQYHTGQWFHPAKVKPAIATYEDVYNSPMVAYAEGLSYSYSDGNITANLDDWNFGTMFKVLLKNDNSKLIHSADKYYLQVKNITTGKYADAKGAFVVISHSNYPTISNGSSNYSGFAAGVQEADGIAFYYTELLSASSADIQFTLYNGQDATITTFTATGKTVTPDTKKCTYVAINYSKFTTLSSALSGSFSVSNTKKVHFSHGNLRYTVSSGIWDFYPNQYDCASTYESNVISLFNWGYNETQSIIPDGSFTDNVSLASGDLMLDQDWGYHVGEKNTWRTLTTKEWQYLFNEGAYANATRAGLYAYGVTVAGKANCTVLYPDGFSGTKVSNGDLTSYDTASEWEAAQNEGVVCLPAVGYRSSGSVNDVNQTATYWSSTAYDSNNAYIVYFNSTNLLSGSYNNRDHGYAVRLVTDAK
ncbi:MAG: hypothetical protein PUC92_00280, partial [bacterium]|nr:hypothetical protein [bacterium]